MKTIKFSDSELEFLQNHYELELADAENYVGEIKNILTKLGVIEKEITKDKPLKSKGKKLGRPKKEKNIVVEEVTTAPAKPIKAAPKKKEKKTKTVKIATPKVVKVKTVEATTEKTPVVKTAAKAKVKKVAKKASPKSASKVAKAAPAFAQVPVEAPQPE